MPCLARPTILSAVIHGNGAPTRGRFRGCATETFIPGLTLSFTEASISLNLILSYLPASTPRPSGFVSTTREPRGGHCHCKLTGVGISCWAPRPCKRSEEHTSELQSPCNLVCRLLLEKKKKK